jgi:fused signal recognition particle receptor
MFKFLKDKLKKAVSKFSKDVEEEAEDILPDAEQPEGLPLEAEREEPVEETEEAVEEKPAPKKAVKEKKKKKDKEPGPEKEEEAEAEVEPEEAEPEKEEEPTEQREAEEAEAEETEKAEEPEPLELTGLRETLDEYTEEQLTSLMDILKFSPEEKGRSREEKIKAVLKKPLVEVNSAIEKLESIEESAEPPKLPEETEEEKEIEELEEAKEEIEETVTDREEAEQEIEEIDREEEQKEEEILEETEKEAEQIEQPEKKKGFLKRIFGIGKKRPEIPEEPEEEKEEEKEEAEEEKEEEKEEAEEEKEEEKEEEIPEAPPEFKEKPEEEKPEAPPPEPEPAEKVPEKKEEEPPAPPSPFEEEKEQPEKEDIDKELEELERKKEQAEERVKEEDAELEGKEKPKGFFGRLTAGIGMKKLSESKFEDIFFELEVALLENNVAVEVIEKIKKDLHEKLVDQKVKRSEIEKIVLSSLRKSLEQILSTEQIDILKMVSEKRKEKKPFVITFVGINGSGKTTTIAKIAKYFMNNDLKPVLVASDTFRAAAIQQLEEHANNLGVKIIKHDYGSDPAAVAFDGIKYAESKGLDVVLIDTAGRLHSNVNLMDEMKKIMRVANPDMKIFVGESITGNDCIEQAQQFNNAVEVDGIVLSKADVDEKGGAAISVSYVTGKPILFIGTGQTYDSLQRFDKSIILSNLGLD